MVHLLNMVRQYKGIIKPLGNLQGPSTCEILDPIISINTWDDASFLVEADKIKFKPLTISVRKQICYRFLKFFSTGDTQGLQAGVILRAAMFLARDKTGTYIFQNHFSSEGSILVPLIENFNPTCLDLTLTDVRNSNFLPYVSFGFLEEKGEEKLNFLERIVGFMALILIRITVKTVDSISKRFSDLERLYKSLYMKLVIFPNPHKTCLSELKNTFYRGHPLCRNVFSILTAVYVHCKRSHPPNKPIVDILDATCMFHSRENGMRMITLALAVIKAKEEEVEGWSKNKLFSYFTSDDTIDSYMRFDRFYRAHMNVENIQFGWKWARFIDVAYFHDFKVSKNAEFCLKCAGFLGIGVMFKMVSLNSLPEIKKNKALLWAQKFNEAEVKCEISKTNAFYAKLDYAKVEGERDEQD
ncbi:unnamed protein product [Gordionus sp. m RMFG-2023]|uniref:uncharacterized protein LOC135929547 isoform X2 n=1 Tax=Gordionus sp. m RMFG-2023 TaxID=3053472 RepID=UPI0030DFECB5